MYICIRIQYIYIYIYIDIHILYLLSLMFNRLYSMPNNGHHVSDQLPEPAMYPLVKVNRKLWKKHHFLWVNQLEMAIFKYF